ncbi:MAG: ATP-binding protein [Fibromonadaceae bacterium]|jgi:predicted AAA+ superfamily ATPase|nr:ATP-binding protein [Fibromonadaceae bacterium]
MLKKRTLANSLERISGNFKVLLLTGMRQVGKTTLLQMCDKNRKYVSLDNPKDLRLAIEEPELFMETYAPPVLIDEVQYAPNLFNHVKMLVDSSSKKGQVWLTGSQQYEMMQGVTESLAGRVAIVNLLGFSMYEREDKGDLQKPFLPSKNVPSLVARKNLLETYRIIWQGSFPDATLMDAENWSAFYSSFIKSYLERDVRQLINIGNLTAFTRFLGIVASRTGQELNILDIANDADISRNTAQSWLSILESSGIIVLLKPWFKNISKRLIKRPKIHWLDTGLCSYLCDWTSPETLEKGAMSGAIFESFVISEIIKSYSHNGKSPTLYYYRDSNKVEIDLLIAQDGLLFPVEIKKTANPSKDNIKAFKTLAQNEEIGYGCVICLTDFPRPLTEEANAISVWDI